MSNNFLHFFKDKIIVRLSLLVIVEVLLVVGGFGLSTYFESQSTAIGNTINIAGKNRYLTSDLLLQFQKANLVNTHAQIKSITNASAALNANILLLKSGGTEMTPTGKIFLEPLPAKYLDEWVRISAKSEALTHYVRALEKENTLPSSSPRSPSGISSSHLIPADTAEILSSLQDVSTTASELIAASNDLAHQLGEDARKNSQDLIIMQTIFIISIAIVGGIIIYIMKRLLRPITLIIEATREVERGNLSIRPIHHCKGSDEITVLATSFNSMVRQLDEYQQTQKQFISIASHELRSPLQPILGLSDVLRSMLGINPEAKAIADSIFYNAKKLQCTIDNVLEATKIEKQLTNLTKERIDICELVRSAIRDALYQVKVSNKSIQVSFMYDNRDSNKRTAGPSDVPTGGVFVNADRTRLVQVFNNLLGNAVKFTTEGLISVTLKEEADANSSDGLPDNSHVVILIKDTGTGIPADTITKLFTKFGTSSATGTGLGLYISKSIIVAHGGKIWAENNTDCKGATFAFSLPIITQ